jgi:autotransporter-associated beta strand protein
MKRIMAKPLGVAAAFLTAGYSLFAQTTYTWAPGGNPDSGGTWDTSTANWTPGPIAWPNNTSPGDNALFGNATAARTVTLSGTINANGILFNDPDPTFDAFWTLASGTVNLLGSALIDPRGNNNYRINSVITGSAGLTLDTTSGSRNSASEVRLGGNNTYTGITLVRDSTLAAYHANALGATGAGNTTIVEADGKVGYFNTSPTTYAAEDILLRHSGAAVRFANGNATLSGKLTVDRTTANGANQVGLDVRDNNRTVTWNGSLTTTSSDNSQSSAQILLSTAGRTSSKIIVNGVITNGLRADSTTMQTRLLITGDSPGTSSIELNGDNSFTGEVTIRGGTLLLGHNNALGTAAGGVFFGDGGGGGGNTMSVLATGSYTIADNFAFQNASGGAYTAIVGGNHTSGTSTFTGGITWGDDAASTYRLTAAAGGTVIFSGVINDGTGTKGIEIVGGGTVVMSGNNTYDGPTTISSGATLQLGNGGTSGQLATTSAINNNGTLVFNRSDAMTQGTHFAATISGTGALVKNGAGILSLSGANASTAGFTLNQGAVYVTHNNALGAGSNPVTVSGLNATELRLNSAGLTLAQPIHITASAGANTFTLRNQVGNNTVSGLITYKNTGTATIDHPVNVQSGTTLNINGGVVGDDTSNPQISRLVFLGAGTLNFNSQVNNSAGGRVLAIQQYGSDGTANWNSGSSGGTMSGIYELARGTINFAANNPINSATISLASGASGASDNINVLMTGPYTVGSPILINNNNSSGLTTIGGTHTSGTSSFTGTVGFQASRALRVSVPGGGTVQFSGVISDGANTGNIIKVGDGTVVFSGANTYDGYTSIEAGTVRIDATRGSTGGTIYVGNGGTPSVAGSLLLGGSGVTLASEVSINPGDGSNRTLGGVNTTGTNTFSGAVKMDGSFGENRSMNLTAAAGGTVQVSGVISGAGQHLTKVGGGTAILANANTYSGNTTINGGVLLVNSPGSLAPGSSVTVNSPGTLGGNGTILGPVSVNPGGTLAPGTSIGTLTVNNTLTLAGSTVLEVNKVGMTLTSDLVTGITTLNCGGNVTVAATGDALAAGDEFTVFNAGTFSGSFSSITPAPGAGLAWDTNKLATLGKLLVHSNPVPGAATASVPLGGTGSLALAKLLAKATGEPGETLSIVSVASPTPAGGSATLGGGFIHYTAPTSGTSDTISYTLSDGRGGLAAGTVAVTLTSTNAASLNIVAGPTLVDNEFKVTFAGIPGQTYTVEDAPSVTGPWNFLTNLTAGANGLFQLVATNDPPLSARYFRTTAP